MSAAPEKAPAAQLVACSWRGAPRRALRGMGHTYSTAGHALALTQYDIEDVQEHCNRRCALSLSAVLHAPRA